MATAQNSGNVSPCEENHTNNKLFCGMNKVEGGAYSGRRSSYGIEILIEAASTQASMSSISDEVLEKK
jgi:hypothetical protein